jgi:hypothetical protein
MSGAYYAVFVIAVLLVIRWAMSDELANGDGYTGLFAMTARRKKGKTANLRKSRFRREEDPDRS